MSTLKYLAGYSDETLHQVQQVISEGRLKDVLLKRYPQVHDVRTDTALYQYTQKIKNDYMGKTQPLSRVGYDSKIKVIQHALGQHHYISRVQGGKLKTVNEIKIASVFRAAPEAFLKMIVVHEPTSKKRNTTRRFINFAAIWSRITTNTNSICACT